MRTLRKFHDKAAKTSEDEWVKKVELDGLKNVKWGTLRRELIWNFIKGLNLSFNHKVIRLVMNGKEILNTQEVVVEFLGLPNNFGTTQIPCFAVDERGSQVSHISKSNPMTRKGWSVTKFWGIYIPRIYAILQAIVFKKKLTYVAHNLVKCVSLAEGMGREFKWAIILFKNMVKEMERICTPMRQVNLYWLQRK